MEPWTTAKRESALETNDRVHFAFRHTQSHLADRKTRLDSLRVTSRKEREKCAPPLAFFPRVKHTSAKMFSSSGWIQGGGKYNRKVPGGR